MEVTLAKQDLFTITSGLKAMEAKLKDAVEIHLMVDEKPTEDEVKRLSTDLTESLEWISQIRRTLGVA